MPIHIDSVHRIVVHAPVDRCFMFFTPAGEELWVDGWRPTYRHPSDGSTCEGMVFTTGHGDELTVWMLADFDRAAHRSRYARVTPGSRTGFVEVQCRAIDARSTEVSVRYTMTALSEQGSQALLAFEQPHYAEMIDGWAAEIAARLPQLLTAEIH
jgi:hypothetical protein